MNRKTLMIFLTVLLISSFSLAQRQTGSINGKVTDAEEVALPGASVTLAGPALMGSLTYVTTEDGDFRFPAVPPGENYEITVEISGFKTLKRGGIIVNVGRTVTLRLQLEQATLTEEVIVRAETPAVDVTSSKLNVTITQELLNNIPLERDFYDVVKTAPGVVLGTEAGARLFSAQGGGETGNQVTVDGISIRDPIYGTNMIVVPFDIYEEFEYEMGFHPAEVATTDGMYINIVTKSGGNTFHGSVSAYYFSDSMVKSLIPQAEAEAVGLNQPEGFSRWTDLSFTLGGPILKDKLWFFVNGNYVDWGLNSETIIDGPFELTNKRPQGFAKLTFSASSNLKFTGAWRTSAWDQPIFVDDIPRLGFFSALSAWTKVDWTYDHTGLFQVNWIPNQNTFFDLRFNYFQEYLRFYVRDGVDENLPYIIDIATGIESGANFFNVHLNKQRYAFYLNGTRFVDNFLGGNHEIKMGAEYAYSPLTVDLFDQNPYIQLQFLGLPWAFHLIGQPYTGLLIGMNAGREKGDVPLYPYGHRFSAYIQDSMTIGDRLTLNLGVRFDNSRGGQRAAHIKPAYANDPVWSRISPTFDETDVPEIKNIINLSSLSPRFGVVYDIFGDGKTSIKASWAMYHDEMVLSNFQFTHPYPQVTEALWIDLNQNALIEPGDLFIPTLIPPDPASTNLNDFIDPNLKTPRTDEYIVGIERELFKDFSVSISYIHKKKTRIFQMVDRDRGSDPNGEWWIPYTVTDPGADGQFGNSDDAPLTVYAVKAGAPPSVQLLTNPREIERKYNGVNFIFNKRMSNNWQFLGSVTLSKFEGNMGAAWGANSTFNFLTPNGYINNYGRLDNDRPVQIKLQGSVQLPLNFMVSGYYSHQSGIPWTRTLTIFFPLDPRFDRSNPQNIVVNADPLGSKRLPARNNLDLRIEKRFNLGDIGRLGFFVDILNALGERYFDIQQDPGGLIFPGGFFQRYPTYGQFTRAIGLRTFKLSVRFTF